MTSYLLETGRVGIKQTKRGLMMFNRNDIFLGRSLERYGEWAEVEIVLLQELVRPGDTVVDVGANIGTHAIALATFVGPGGTVHAFEPQRHIYNLLCGNIALNAKDRVYCYRQAVGAASGFIDVPVYNPDRALNFGAVVLDEPARFKERVDVVTVDSLKLESCRLIKADVEGMEAAVLEGAADTIRRLRPFLLVECTGNTRETIALLQRFGYRVWWQIASYFNQYNFFGDPENVFARFVPQANLICAPAESKIELAHLPECKSADETWESIVTRGNGQS